MQLTLLGSSVKRIVSRAGLLYHFTEAGVDVHDLADGTRVAWASLSNVTTGAVNDDGIYLGTSAAGVYKLAHASVTTGGDRTADLAQTYTTGTTPALQSNQVNGMAGRGAKLLVTGPAGADYLPSAATVYHYADAGGCGACAIGATKIAYALSYGGLHLLAFPAADWNKSGAEFLGGPDLPGFGVHFDANAENLDFGDKAAFNLTVLTLEIIAEFSALSPNNYKPLIGKRAYGAGGGYHLSTVQGTNEILWEITNGTPQNFACKHAIAPSPGKRFHIAGTFDGSTSRLFIDGVLKDSVVGASMICSNTQTLRANRDYGGPGSLGGEHPWKIHEIRLWNVARTQAQLDEYQNRPLQGNESGLVGLWRLNEGAGTTAQDATANANDGTITGAGWVEAPATLSAVVQDLGFGAGDVLFVGTDAGVSIWDGSSVTDITTPLGTVLDVKSIRPTPQATAASGLLAYGTADGLGGGRFGVLDLSAV